MTRWRFVASRLVMLPASLLVASFVIFAALYLEPGTPLAALSGGQPLPPGSVQVLEQRYHLNESFLAQYWYWLDDALHGNLGVSITLRENVSTLIASRIWTTAGLVLYASLIIVATECAFAARCTHAGEICRVAVPDLVELDGGVSRCARARELRGQLQAAPDG